MLARPDKPAGDWTGRLRHEFVEYLVNVVYLALVVTAFTQVHRLSLAAYDIVYTNYWVAVINALILGKVIMVGGIFRLGRGLEKKPLIFSTLYKALVFTVFILAFACIEHAIKGLWNGQALLQWMAEPFAKGFETLLAKCLVIFVALAPFFAIKELGRVLGVEKMAVLFFRKGPGP
jgi:hypothetical protein